MSWPTARRAVGLAVMVAAVGYVGWRILSDGEAREALVSIPAGAVAGLIALQVIYLLPQAYRYLIALRQATTRTIPALGWFRLFVVGRFLNALIPQGGTAYRGLRLKEDYGVPIANYLGGFVAFTWLSTVLNMIIAGAAIGALEPELAIGETSALAVTLAALAALAIGPLALRWLIGRLHLEKGSLGWTYRRLTELMNAATAVVRSPMTLLQFVIAGLIGLTVAIGLFRVTFDALALEVSVSTVLLFFVVLQISTYISLTPGNLGVLELGFGALSVQLGIGLVGGLLAATVIRITGYIALLIAGVLLGGLKALERQSVRFSWVRAAARRLESLPTLNRLIRPTLLATWDLAWQPAIRLRMLRNGPLAVLDLDIGNFTVDLRDKGLAWPLYRYRVYEPEERAVMRRLVLPGMDVVDVGAHFGYHTRLLAGLIGDHGRVAAIEAAPENFGILQINLEGEIGKNVIAVNVAASESEGELEMAMHRTNRGMHHIVHGPTNQATIKVPAATVDSIVADHGLWPAFVKMDIEGAEVEALLGMSRILQAEEITFLTELNQSALKAAGRSGAELLAHFADRGFQLFSLKGEGQVRKSDQRSLLEEAEKTPNVNFIAARGEAAMARILEAGNLPQGHT